MLNLSWANEMAKAALKNAQQKIDSVLDIKAEENDQTKINYAVDDSASSHVLNDGPKPETDDFSSQELTASTSQIDPSNETDADSEIFSDYLSMGFGKTPVLEDDKNCDVNEMQDMESQQTISSEPVLPPTISRQSSVLDEASTVVSSDIEVVRQMDTWSIGSSRACESQSDQNLYRNDAISSLQTQLKINKHREIEQTGLIEQLTSNNNILTTESEQLKERLSKLLHELQVERNEREDIVKEAKRSLDYSTKQSKEIRRLKNELGEVTKMRNDLKRLKDDKMELNEQIEELKEQIITINSLMKEKNNEVSQLKSELEKNHTVIETMECEKDSTKKNVLEQFGAEKEELLQSIEHYKNTAIAASLEKERTLEMKDAVLLELRDAREEIKRLLSQINQDDQKNVIEILDTNAIADAISMANAPLLEEISELQCQISHERKSLSEAEKVIRNYSAQVDSLMKNQKLLSEKSIEDRQLQQSQLDKSDEQKRILSQENANLSVELKDLRDVVETMREEMKKAKVEFNLKMERFVRKNTETTDALVEERDNLRIELQNLKNADTSSISMIKNDNENVNFEKQHLYDRGQMDILRHENQKLRIDLKEITKKYDQLLEIDGEKLERIEELQQDVIDLRKLIKQQLLDFASRNDEHDNKMN
ncbi:unnamed protein product [Auanema sp. JU1783]|nr:unnamed protein product [Auanema sp. JU1783]